MKDKQLSFEDDFTEEDTLKSDLVFWDYKAKPEIVGYFKKWESDNYGQHAVLLVQNAEDVEEIHLPNLTALNGLLNKADCSEENNHKVKIVFNGEKKSDKSGRMYNSFNVYVKK